MLLAATHAERVRTALLPQTRLLRQLVEAAGEAGAIGAGDVRRTTAFIQQTVMYSWIGNRLIHNPRNRVTAEETWEFCLHGLHLRG